MLQCKPVLPSSPPYRRVSRPEFHFLAPPVAGKYTNKTEDDDTG